MKNSPRKNNVFEVKIEATRHRTSVMSRHLLSFNRHKQPILGALRKVCERKSRAFDPGKSWIDLTSLAQLYFSLKASEQEAGSGAELRQRLRKLAQALRTARGLTERALNDELGNLLFVALCEERGLKHDLKNFNMREDGTSLLIGITNEITEMTRSLGTLQTLALRAAAAPVVGRKDGRPSLLPRDCIQGLARIYRTATGSKPGRGDGPFAVFASAFFSAVAQKHIPPESLIDAIQDAHRQFKPSWFDGKPPKF